MITSFEERQTEVRGRIAQAARDFGRDPGSVTLVCVSKTFPAEAIEPALSWPLPSSPTLAEKSNMPPETLLTRRALPAVVLFWNTTTLPMPLVMVALPAVDEPTNSRTPLFVMVALAAVLLFSKRVLPRCS